MIWQNTGFYSMHNKNIITLLLHKLLLHYVQIHLNIIKQNIRNANHENYHRDE